ncbi:hypothetical protein GF374_02830 [Candidatus Woesearchaeota archaeon]|nr:hypothetical protein [Candidatus Woesearchaeota archaeon]
MATKKGVSTKMILSLGIVLLVAIVLLIGANIIAPLFKDTPAYVAIETAFSIDAINAAPEDANFEFKFPSQAEECDFRIYDKKVELYCQKISFAPKTYTEKFFAKEIKDISENQVKKFRLTKKYDETKGENTKIKIGVKLKDKWYFF